MAKRSEANPSREPQATNNMILGFGHHYYDCGLGFYHSPMLAEGKHQTRDYVSEQPTRGKSYQHTQHRSPISRLQRRVDL